MTRAVAGWLVLSGWWVTAGWVSPAGATGQHQVLIAAAATAGPETADSTDPPRGLEATGDFSLLPEQSTGPGDDELFGLRGGYFHPYLSLGIEHTDNLYYVDEDETANTLFKVSPGIWFSLPRTKEIPIAIEPHNTSPGGLQAQVGDFEGTDRYQAYALAGGDYLMYSEDSDLNDFYGKMETLFRYNLRGGLSLQALDRFSYAQDRFEYGGESGDYLLDYISNIFMATADYRITEKLRTKIDYSHFLLNYEDAISEFFDRADQTLDLYGYFRYSPKTSFFLQYRLTEVSYDTTVERDNTQHYVYGGMTWYTTEKVSLVLKAGYQTRAYENEVLAEGYDWDGVTFNLQSLYRWTEKTRFSLDLYRTSEESDSVAALDKVVFGLSLGYRQDFTEKLTGLVNLKYEQAAYTQLVDNSRNDERIHIRPALRYLFRDWLMLEAAYVADIRDSTDDAFDYTTNTFLFSLNVAL